MGEAATLAEALFVEAALTGQVYRTKRGWKTALTLIGVGMCALIVTIPLGIWFIVAARRGSVALGEEGFAIKRFLTRAYRWQDIESLRLGTIGAGTSGNVAGDLIGAAVTGAIEARTAGLKGPILFRLKGQRGERAIATQSIESSAKLKAELERRTGLHVT
jgi:hypothetical protein